MMSLTTQLCDTLKEGSGRAVLNTRDVQRLDAIVKLRVPEELLKSWLSEALAQRNAQGQRPSSAQSLSVLERRAQQWAQQHVAEGYEREAGRSAEGRLELEALEALIASVDLSAQERATAQSAPLFEWLLERLRQLAAELKRGSDYELSALLSELDEALYAEVDERLPELSRQTHSEVLASLKRERNRSRPQDFARSLRAVTWARLRAELQLPQLYLPLFGSW